MSASGLYIKLLKIEVLFLAIMIWTLFLHFKKAFSLTEHNLACFIVISQLLFSGFNFQKRISFACFIFALW